MIPAARKVVTKRAWGAASRSLKSPPVWSRSGWVSQIQRTVAGSITVLSTPRKSRSGRLTPVSMTTGSLACNTNALMGRNPIPGTSR